MRYINADEHSFTSADGVTAAVKDILPVAPSATSFLTVACDSQTSLDEISSREDIYGEGAESSAYKIFDENIVEIVEAGFDLSKLRTLRVPT